MDRDRTNDRDATPAARSADRTFIADDATSDRVVFEENRDVSGDALAPSDQDIVVRQDTADTMPSRALNDPRELTPADRQRFSTDTTDAAGATNMAGRPLEGTPTAAGFEAVATPGAGVGTGIGTGSDTFALIREGMRVIDAAGEEIGKVDFVSMGDPQAITKAGQEMDRDDSLLEDFAEAFAPDAGEPDVPEPFRSRLIREGYVKVDGKGWFGSDSYLTPDMVARVEGDAVVLAVTRDSIPNDQG